MSFARDPSEGGRRLGGGGGQITSKGDGLLRSNLALGDSLLRGAGYFVTVQVSLSRDCVTGESIPGSHLRFYFSSGRGESSLACSKGDYSWVCKVKDR